MTYQEEVKIAKLKLSGFHDRALADILPGASRVASEVSDLLDRMLVSLQSKEPE